MVGSRLIRLINPTPSIKSGLANLKWVCINPTVGDVQKLRNQKDSYVSRSICLATSALAAISSSYHHKLFPRKLVQTSACAGELNPLAQEDPSELLSREPDPYRLSRVSLTGSTCQIPKQEVQGINWFNQVLTHVAQSAPDLSGEWFTGFTISSVTSHHWHVPFFFS